MNILMVHNYYQLPGGEDMVVENEKNMLTRHGHKVVVYTRNNSELKDMGKVKKLSMVFSTVFSMKTYREIRKIIKDEKIDIINVHNTLSLISPSVYYAGLSMKVPVFQTIHNFRLLCPAATFYRNGHICELCTTKGLLCSIKNKCYRGSRFQSFASAVILWFHRMTGVYKKINYICLTDFNRQKLLKGIKGLKENRVFVKPNFTAAPDKEESLMGDYYLYAGRLEKIKGTDIMLKAWKHMKDDGITPKLIICGTGDLKEKAEKYVTKNGLDNVEFKGFVENHVLKKMMRDARAVILPTQWYEGFPVSIAESYSMGTPVITGDVGNAGDLVKDGITGLKYTYNSHEDLAEAILKMEKTGDAKYREMRSEVRDTYDRLYNEETNYKILCEIYGIR